MHPTVQEIVERPRPTEYRGERVGDWIQTFTGRAFYLLDPRPEDVDILDIAVALSRAPRYAGHSRCTYSVAQHSYFASIYAPKPFALEALLHDATEAYTGDITRPLKRILGPVFADIEKRIHFAIAERFRIPKKISAEVKVIDDRLLATERRDLLGKPPIPWHHDERGIQPLPIKIEPQFFYKTLGQFISRFEELTDTRIDTNLFPMS
jgi:uncharacterized protein